MTKEWRGSIISGGLDEAELIAQELSGLSEKARALEQRLANVEEVNARLEHAALTTARALQEISGHWAAVHEAMRCAASADSTGAVYPEEEG